MSRADPAPPNRVLTVVIAEDSRTQAAQLAFLLEEQGFSVHLGLNGRQALALVEEHRPELVITDVMMPEMDGYELCRAIKSRADLQGTSVIMVTELNSPQNVLRGLQAGADNFIVKPYAEDILLTRIDYLLNNKKLRQIGGLQIGVEIELGGERHFITAERQQILDLLISTYEQAIRLYDELEARQRELARSYATLNSLFDLSSALPLCRSKTEVARCAVDHAVKLPGVQAAWLYLLEDGEYHLAATSAPGEWGRPVASERCRCQADFAAGVLTEISNVDGCPLLAPLVAPPAAAVHAAIPLRAGERKLGVLNLLNAENRRFDEQELRTMSLAGARVASALEHAGLQEHLAHLVAERTEALRHEVAERRQAEAAARAAEAAARDTQQTMAAILDSSPMAVITLKQDGTVASWNRAAETVFGYTAEEAIGKPHPGTPRDLADQHRAQVATISSTDQELHGFEIRQRRKDGTMIDVRVSGRRLENSGLGGGVFVFEDITSERKIAAQLRQSQKMEAIGNLTGGLAHDFNNLLTIVTGNLTLLVDEMDRADPSLELVDDALQAAWRGAELNRQLLAFARRQPLESKRIQVNEHLDHIVRLTRRTLGETIRINTIFAPDIWPVFADPSQLETAILNLSTNARDAMPDGGSITMASSNVVITEDYTLMNPDIEPGEYVVVSVTDTGTGMSRETLEHIFEPFFTTKSAGTGTGLGLAMVFGFAQQSGGHIKAYSELGHGTTMRLYLPRDVSDGSVVAHPPNHITALRGNETVLVVDDNPDVQRVVVRQLRELGYRPIEAQSAAAALALLEQRDDIELLVTDVVMPETDGVALARRAREHRPGLPVVFVSGFPGSSFEGARSLPEGAALISKPFHRDDLALQIRRLLQAAKGQD